MAQLLAVLLQARTEMAGSGVRRADDCRDALLLSGVAPFAAAAAAFVATRWNDVGTRSMTSRRYASGSRCRDSCITS